MKLTLAVIGKLRNSSLQQVEKNYLKRLHFLQLKIVELKSHSSDLEKEQIEIENFLKTNQFSPQQTILLTEKGQAWDSKQLSQKIQQLAPCVLLIGGAMGWSADFLKRYPIQMSLSPLTFPHQLARVLVVEQIYRAQCLLTSHPYHH